jgi:hypothetical protein
MDKIYVQGMYASDASTPKQREFIVSRLAIRVSDFITFLKDQNQHVDDKGFLRMDIKRSLKDPNNLYGELNTWKPSGKAVTSAEHSPDREAEDLPF